MGPPWQPTKAPGVFGGQPSGAGAGFARNARGRPALVAGGWGD